MNHYFILGTIATIYISRDILSKINENAKRKQILHFLYKDYCKCLELKGFLNHGESNIDINNDFHRNFGKIIENKDVRELESCKSQYFQFMKAYFTYKNESF